MLTHKHRHSHQLSTFRVSHILWMFHADLKFLTLSLLRFSKVFMLHSVRCCVWWSHREPFNSAVLCSTRQPCGTLSCLRGMAIFFCATNSFTSSLFLPIYMHDWSGKYCFLFFLCVYRYFFFTIKIWERAFKDTTQIGLSISQIWNIWSCRVVFVFAIT